MILYSSLEGFVKIANERQLLQPLLPAKDCTVCFQYDRESYSLHFSRQGFFLSSDIVARYTFRFKYEQDLRDALSGEMRLQSLLRQNRVEFEGTFRILLLIESLFYLSQVGEKTPASRNAKS